jgi:hypothetical protein
MGLCFGTPKKPPPPRNRKDEDRDRVQGGRGRHNNLAYDGRGRDNANDGGTHAYGGTYADKHGKLVDKHGARVFPMAQKHRNLAERAAKDMRRCAQEAEAAYTRKDHARAKEAKAAKEHARGEMNRQNALAMKAILSPQQWDTIPKLDLHGLYVSEAEKAVREMMSVWRKKQSSSQSVEIITGAGHHSEGHHAKIRPAIERVLRHELHMQYELEHGNGAVIVQL